MKKLIILYAFLMFIWLILFIQKIYPEFRLILFGISFGLFISIIFKIIDLFKTANSFINNRSNLILDLLSYVGLQLLKSNQGMFIEHQNKKYVIYKKGESIGVNDASNCDNFENYKSVTIKDINL